MGIKKVIIVLTIFFLLTKARCVKTPLDCANSKYSFELGIKAYPDKDSIDVGDTIWLEVNEPTTLKNSLTGQMINYSNTVNLGSAIGFQKAIFIPALNFIPAAEKFGFKLIEGVETRNTNPLLFKEFLFTASYNYYSFKLAVIPKDTGIFRIVFSNANNVYRKDDGCTKAFFEINFKGTAQHRYLIPGFADNTSKGGDYYFKVK